MSRRLGSGTIIWTDHQTLPTNNLKLHDFWNYFIHLHAHDHDKRSYDFSYKNPYRVLFRGFKKNRVQTVVFFVFISTMLPTEAYKGFNGHAKTRSACATTSRTFARVPPDVFGGPVTVLGTIGVHENGRRRRSRVRIKIHGSGACAFCFPKSTARDRRTSPRRQWSATRTTAPGHDRLHYTTTCTRPVRRALVTRRCWSTTDRPTPDRHVARVPYTTGLVGTRGRRPVLGLGPLRGCGGDLEDHER